MKKTFLGPLEFHLSYSYEGINPKTHSKQAYTSMMETDRKKLSGTHVLANVASEVLLDGHDRITPNTFTSGRKKGQNNHLGGAQYAHRENLETSKIHARLQQISPQAANAFVATAAGQAVVAANARSQKGTASQKRAQALAEIIKEKSGGYMSDKKIVERLLIASLRSKEMSGT